MALLALLLQWSLRPWIGARGPFLIVLPALIFAVIALGRGPGGVVLIAGAISGALWFEPLGSLTIANAQDAAVVCVYLVVGALLILYGGRFRVTTSGAALAEERLTLALEKTGVGVFELDFAAETAFISPGLCRLLGQPVMKGSIPLDSWLGALHPEHVNESRRALERQVSAGELEYEREQRVVLKNGEVRWLLNRVRLDVAPSGQLARARGAAVDITERKRLDELLQKTQSDLRQQLQDLQRLHALSQKLVGSGDDFRVALRALLDAMLDLFGARHGLLWLFGVNAEPTSVGAHAGLDDEALLVFTRPADASRASPGLLDSHASSPSFACDRFVGQLRARAGQAGFPAMHVVPLISSGGETVGLITVMFAEAHEVDVRETRLSDVCAITAAAVVEREGVRALAAKNEQRFEVALESSAVPFNILAPVHDAQGEVCDFRWSYINPAGARTIGLEAAQLIGRAVTDVLPATWDQRGLLARYVGVLKSGEPAEFEARASRNTFDGWFHVVASRLHGSVAIWFADISERKRAEQALLEADRRKDEFLATLAHELRNPLAPIRQAIWIARSSSSDAQLRRSHDVIERQVKNMALLLDDLLDLSRVTRGALNLRKTRASFSAVIDDALETARPHIEAKRHRLTLDLPMAPPIVEIDPLRLAQVIGNLLTNAAKYTDPGGDIRLSADRTGPDLVIRVADSGVGLNRAQLEHVFDMFTQVPGVLDRSQGGLGIGLALSRKLIELHGGRIEAASAGLGRGSEFSIHLPGVCLSDVPETAGVDPELAKAPESASLRILIADDNVDAAESLAELMRMDGHEVRVVNDGRQALEAFQGFNPEAALLDVGMPRLSGLEVAHAIRLLPSGGKAVLIALTGWGREQDRSEALDAGFDYHATKPADPALLQALIASGRSVNQDAR